MVTQPSSEERGEPLEVARDLDATANWEVRQQVRELLAPVGGLLEEDAVLVTEELISNAHRHGTAPRRCRLGLLDDGRRLRIEVEDTAPEQPKIRTPDRTGGRGLVLVDRLASSWGVHNHRHHKTVWAELSLDQPGTSGHARHLAPASKWSRPKP
ncbi:ATP-binding protein [Amycolatopsis sp. YIM 10]|uniref:ATP-binding protein n=1 Tax=Amycolatopsis sp. YIM 10 TaxID=2653857 RepID=UPI00129040DF|nr:ATP-binding protein [Amycolatopsis sp. YIM 10]